MIITKTQITRRRWYRYGNYEIYVMSVMDESGYKVMVYHAVEL